MSDIKREFDIGIAMIESGEAEQAIIDDENNLQHNQHILHMKAIIPTFVFYRNRSYEFHKILNNITYS